MSRALESLRRAQELLGCLIGRLMPAAGSADASAAWAIMDELEELEAILEVGDRAG